MCYGPYGHILLFCIFMYLRETSGEGKRKRERKLSRE